MPAVTSRRVEYAVIGLALLAASYLLFVPPIVGLADQGDYSRLTARVGLAPPSSITSYVDQVNCWVVTHWNIVAARPLPVFSTAEFPVRTAILLHKAATSATILDIRWVSGVYLALFLGLILAVLRSARKLPAAAYFVIAAGLVLVCTDSEYISYFNSFLTESAALLGVLAFVAAGLAAVTAEDPSWLHMAAIVPAAAFLAGSKAQNAILGIFAACWMVWLFRRKPAQRYTAMVAGLVLACFSGFVLTRAPLPESNLFNTIYDRVVPNSTDPQQAIAELGLKSETAAWVGQAYWAVKIDSPDSFPGKATRLGLLTFYLRHPPVDLRMARGALTLSNDLEGMGNFPRESGAPRTTRTQAFTGYDRLRAWLASIWLVFPLLAANISAVLIWRSRVASLISLLGTMAAVAFLTASFYDAWPQKHLFTFNLLFDVLLFADLSAAAAWVAGRSTNLPRFERWGRVLAGFLLLLLLGIALRLEAFPKGFWKGSFWVSDLAVDKPATQSSTFPGDSSAAASAVDGNTDGNFFHNSVTTTNPDPNAWWEVDLGASRAVGSIAIWNRTDCCPSRLSDYWVFLSDTPFSRGDTPATLQNRAGTWKRHQTLAPDPVTALATGGAKGRYVRVQLTGTGYLSLAEVQVSASGPNLAAGKPATQSSILSSHPAAGAGRAVDGNVDGDFTRGSVTATNPDSNAWWGVDLGASTAVGSIAIWNRTECCNALLSDDGLRDSRLSDYWVFLSDTPFSPGDTPATLQNRAGTWKSHQTLAPNPATAIGTSGAKGRYVRVQLAGRDYLSLAEVQVFGQ